jgi:hypothetical protein
MAKTNAARRRSLGSALAEFGPAMFLTFIVLTIPVATFGTMAMRYAFLTNAARLAASAGSQCKTFLQDTSSSDPSAVTLANNVVNKSVGSFAGISVMKTTCYIAYTPLAGGSVTRNINPLSNPADTSANAYNFEVRVDGQVQPLITSSTKFFGVIPGLTAPITTSVRAASFFENTQGLNQ